MVEIRLSWSNVDAHTIDTNYSTVIILLQYWYCCGDSTKRYPVLCVLVMLRCFHHCGEMLVRPGVSLHILTYEEGFFPILCGVGAVAH